jgi:aldehyde dehydrogenase (NAD+)
MTTSDGARLFIGGHFRAAEQTADVVEAATEAALGEGASATAADVDAAVGAARSALPGWRSTPPQERAVIIGAFAGALNSRAQSTSELISRDRPAHLGVSDDKRCAAGGAAGVLRQHGRADCS